MTKIFIMCLVLFPVIFVGVLVATGTLNDLKPELRADLARKVAGPGAVQVVDEGPDEIDSLLVRSIEAREATARHAIDSLAAIQGRIETERRELTALSANIQAMVGEVDSLHGSMTAAREKERRTIANIMDQMEPERAAGLLALLDADSMEFLVKAMKPRQAAEVLGLLPTAVAAPLVQQVLRDSGSPPVGATP